MRTYTFRLLKQQGDVYRKSITGILIIFYYKI